MVVLVAGIRFLDSRDAEAEQGREMKSVSIEAPSARPVAALGRFEPEEGLIRLAAPALYSGARVARMHVKEGALVQAGQLIATLDVEKTKAAELREAREQVAIAQARLAQTRAPARAGEFSAQQAVIDRLQAELQQARNEYERYQPLAESGDVPALRVSARRLAVETLEAELARARAQQSLLREFRPVDADVASAEIAQAAARAQRLELELEQTRIRAPQSAQIFKLLARAGEAIGPRGIIEMGRTMSMFVIAEVFENDVPRLRQGARATIRTRALPEELRGAVEQIGLQLGKKEMVGNDAAVDAEARVVEVRIRLDEASSCRAAALTNMRVEVEIEP